MAIDMDTSIVVPIQHTRSAPGTPVGHPPAMPRCSQNNSKAYAIEKKSDVFLSKWSLDEGSNRETASIRSNARWRRQDEKSQRSVRDKIAMFSSEKSEQPNSKTRKLDKHEIQEGYIKRSLTEDNVCTEINSSISNDLIGDSSRSLSKAAGFSSMINVSTSETKENIKPIKATYSEIDIRKDISPVIIKEKQKIQKPKDDSDKNGLNERSQSLSDIGRPTLTKRHSMGAYDCPTIFKYGAQKQDEKDRRTSLTNLIEQRRKSMSKLRGLVIPESQMNNTANKKSSLDLPRIASVSPTTPHKTSSLPREGHRHRISKAESFSSFDTNDLSSKVKQSANSSFQKRSPSPVVKKKSVNSMKKNDCLPPAGRHYSNQDTPLVSDQLIQSPNSAFSNTSFRDLDTSSESEYSSSVHSFTKHIISQKNSFESKYSLDDDSDNDSALSSTQSSLSQLSTPSSPVPGHYHDDHRHHKYRSQSSYDEHDPRRFLKRGSIEAENRRNILNSARSSSGRGSDNDHTAEEMNKFDTDTESLTNFIQADRDTHRTRNYRNRISTSSTSSAASSRRSSHDSHDSSRRNSRESVIHVIKKDETKVSAEPVYFDQEGDMYKESQLKVAYLNEIDDNYEQLNEIPANKVIAEVPVASNTLHNTESAKKERPFSLRKSSPISELNMKYNINNDSKVVESKRSISETKSFSNGNKVGSFQALAEKWQNRDENIGDTDTIRRKSSSKISPLSPTAPKVHSVQYTRTSKNQVQRDNIPDRKFSMPEYSSKGVILRDRQEGAGGGISSRPTSLIEGGDALDNHNHYLNSSTLSPSISMISHDSLCSPDTNLSRTGSKEVLDAFSKPRTGFTFTSNRNGASNIPKMSDIMRAFERHDLKRFSHHGSHPRMSSLDSNTSEDGSIGAHYGSITSLSGQRDQYGSITSLASSTSLISPQELASLIEEANQSLEESGTPSHEIMVVVLHREVVAHGSIGITLHGGADYEAKEITIHKVIPGGLADRDGRLQRGDRVLSINGKNLRGVTHREALNILKSPRPEVVLVLSRSRSVTPQENTGDNDYGYIHRTPLINHTTLKTRPPKILESPMDSKSLVSDVEAMLTPRGAPITTTLLKDGAGLGFSLEGGKDSPLGDRPLTIKKIFSGGAADKSGFLKVGDEIVSINSVDVTKMARIEAWNYLKKLPDGTVTLNIRQKLENSSKSEE